jgi:hypothetical protein
MIDSNLNTVIYNALSICFANACTDREIKYLKIFYFLRGIKLQFPGLTVES